MPFVGTRNQIGDYGSFYFSSAAATTLGVATPAKAAGTTTVLEEGDFDHSNNRLTYVGAKTKKFFVTASFSFTKASGTATVATVSLAKNGTGVTGLEADVAVGGTDTTPNFAALSGIVELTNADYVELFLETDTGDDLTVTKGAISLAAIEEG